MKRTRILLVAMLLATAGVTTFVQADETITVNAQSSEISAQLDLRTVANLFARSKDLEEFELLLNDPDSAFTNLDLNGDGQVDYLRVVETTSGNKHLIVLQAILAKDIFQDVATITVEKEESSGQVTTKIVGDERIYGVNYIIEPVYYYRPVIYDWFWGPTWVCWNSPWYWGYYPGWWHPFAPCPVVVYVDRCRCHNYAYRGCSYRCSAPVRQRDAYIRQSLPPHRDSGTQHGVASAGHGVQARSNTYGTRTTAQAPARTGGHGSTQASAHGATAHGTTQASAHGATANRTTGHGNSATASVTTGGHGVQSRQTTSSSYTSGGHGSMSRQTVSTTSSYTPARTYNTSSSSYSGGHGSSSYSGGHGGSSYSGGHGGSFGGGSSSFGGGHGGGASFGGGGHSGGGGHGRR